MKKLTLLFGLALIIQAIAVSQPCLPDGITFSNQEEINNFQTNHPNCTEIVGSVLIKGNDITNLNGLSVLTAIGTLEIGNLEGGNPSLTSLTGLDNVTSIGWGLGIVYNDVLTSLSGLNNLTSIGLGIGIMGNAALTSLTGLDNITSIGGGFAIGDNPALTSLTGLDNLTSIPGLLYIWDCPSLTSLTGLANVTSIGGELAIVDNDVLPSLMGLDNIDAASIDSLRISQNNSLSTCEVQSVCDYLASPGGTISIGNNAIGCSSQQEVEEACVGVSVPNLNVKFEFSIYPNPATDKLIITSNNGLKIKTVNIYNQLGQKVFHRNEIRENIDISTLGQGIYIIELTSKEQKFRQKLVIQ